MFEVELSPEPAGLVFDPEFLTREEERALLDELERLEFREIVMHGVAARRSARRVAGVERAHAISARIKGQLEDV